MVAGVEDLTPGDVVEYSIDDLNRMKVDTLARLAHSIGINVSGLTNRNQVLTRLMESATDISLLH